MEFIRKTPEEVIKEITNTVTKLTVLYNPYINAMVYTVSCNILGADGGNYPYLGEIYRTGNIVVSSIEDKRIYEDCLSVMIRRIVLDYKDPQYKERFSRGVYSKAVKKSPELLLKEILRSINFQKIDGITYDTYTLTTSLLSYQGQPMTIAVKYTLDKIGVIKLTIDSLRSYLIGLLMHKIYTIYTASNHEYTPAVLIYEDDYESDQS